MLWRGKSIPFCNTNFSTNSVCTTSISKQQNNATACYGSILLLIQWLFLHLFSINWWRMHDLPVPEFPITRNLNRKSATFETAKIPLHSLKNINCLLKSYTAILVLRRYVCGYGKNCLLVVFFIFWKHTNKVIDKSIIHFHETYDQNAQG